ncbi:MAG: hypothetical protein ACPF83_07300 [Flavobacteriales bacterium]
MRLLLAALIACATLSSSAQLDSVYAVVHYQDDGTVPGYPCGYTTYRIYAQLSGSEFKLGSVLSSNTEGADLFIGVEDGGIWNSSFGGMLGSEMNPELYTLFPKVEYDSFVTINRTSMEDEGDQLIYNMNADEYAQMQTSFGIPVGTEIGEDGDVDVIGEDLWFEMTAAWTAVDMSEPSENNEPVLMAQLTTNGTLHWRLNVLVHETVDDVDNSIGYYHPHADPSGGTYGQTIGLVGAVYNEVICGVYEQCYLPADFDQSGMVDVPDALALLAEYGCQSDCLLDLDGDGQVQTSDLLDLLAQLWSGCD